MKWICYKVFCGKRNIRTEEKPIYEDIIQPTRLGWNEANKEIAKREAYNGEYTIEDDGVEETHEPTDAERIAELEEALAMLLNEVVE